MVYVYPRRRFHVGRVKPSARDFKGCRPLEFLEYLRRCLPVRGPWFIAVLGEVVGGKQGHDRPRHGGDLHQSPHRLRLSNVAHLKFSNVSLMLVGVKE